MIYKKKSHDKEPGKQKKKEKYAVRIFFGAMSMYTCGVVKNAQCEEKNLATIRIKLKKHTHTQQNKVSKLV